MVVVDRHNYRFAYHFSLCELEEKVQTFTAPTFYTKKDCGCGIIDEYGVGNTLPTRPLSVQNGLKLEVSRAAAQLILPLRDECLVTTNILKLPHAV